MTLVLATGSAYAEPASFSFACCASSRLHRNTLRQPSHTGMGNSARGYALSRGEDHACLAFAQARLALLRALLPDGLAAEVFGCLADGGAARAPLEVIPGQQILVLLGF